MNDFNVCLIVPYYYKQTQHQIVCIMKIKGPFVKLNNVWHNTCLTLKVIFSNQNSKSKNPMVQFRFFNIHISHVICIFFWEQQWFIDIERGCGKQSFQLQPNVKLWKQNKTKAYISSCLVQPRFWMSRAFAKKIQDFHICWNGWKLHGWEIFDEIKLSKSLNIFQMCVEMAKVLWYYTWDNIHEST